MCAGFRVAVLESLAYVAPATPRELARVLAALQSSVMRDAAMPSHGNVISVAALGAAARLAAAFPAARTTISTQLAIVSECATLSPQVRRAPSSLFPLLLHALVCELDSPGAFHLHAISMSSLFANGQVDKRTQPPNRQSATGPEASSSMMCMRDKNEDWHLMNVVVARKSGGCCAGACCSCAGTRAPLRPDARRHPLCSDELQGPCGHHA